MLLRAVGASLVALTLSSAPALYAQSSLSEDDLSAIRTLLEVDFTKRSAGGHFADFMKLFEEDAVFLPAGEPAIHGAANMLEWLERNWGPLPIEEHEQKAVQVDGRGDLAYARGRYRIVVKIEGTGTRIHDQGKFLVILKKQEGGGWLLSEIMYSRDTEKPHVEANDE